MNLTANKFDIGNAQACAFYASAAYGAAQGDGVTGLWDSVTDTHVLIVENSQCVLLAFCGTRVDSIRNWITDAQFFRATLAMDAYGASVQVHAGFLRAMNGILPAIKAALDKMAVGDRPLFITGHSLGGSLALLGALALSRAGFKIAQVYTFGQPRVGNAAWCQTISNQTASGLTLADRIFRLVYQEDIVPRVPHLPSITDPYRHVGTEVFISSTSPIRSVADLWMDPPLWRLLISDAWGIYRAWCVSRFAGAIDPIVDHHMENYVRAMRQAGGGN